MSTLSAGFGELAEEVSGPPVLLGQRGCPADAPENTLAGFRLALAAGLDGIAYEARACATGDPVLLRDERIDRTTDGTGAVAELTLLELFHVDAGAWFGKAFVGEPVPLFDEVLELAFERGPGASTPIHWVEAMHSGVVNEIVRRVSEYGGRRSIRIASRSRDACLEIRDAGLSPVYVAHEAGEDERRFVRDQRIAGFATAAPGWRTDAAQLEWPCERWGVDVSSPEELLELCRVPLNGLVTDEPVRALATRALCRYARDDDGAYPVQVPLLPIEPGGIEGPHSNARTSGEWAGRWAPLVKLRNPFPYDVRVGLGLRVRRGAFEVEGLPAQLDLVPGEECEVPFRLVGGSWSPGGDPIVMAIYEWSSGPDRPAGKLILDAPLRRVRAVTVDGVSRRLQLLQEHPGDPTASMTIRKSGPYLLVSIENPGDLEDPHVLVHLDGHEVRGGAGVRALLPEGFENREHGIDFSCAVEGWRLVHGERSWAIRRWAGGVPGGTGAGSPGLILPIGES